MTVFVVYRCTIPQNLFQTFINAFVTRESNVWIVANHSEHTAFIAVSQNICEKVYTPSIHTAWKVVQNQECHGLCSIRGVQIVIENILVSIA